VRYLLRSGTLLAAGFTLPTSLLLVIFGQPLMSALWGAEFLPTAYYALLILLAGGLAANLLYWGRKTLLSLGLPGYPTLVSLVAAAAKVVGIILLVPTWGAVGMAVLLAGFFIATSTIQAGRAIVELEHVARAEPAPAGG
jgi:O-antigen/teichoic acid export membrane protein